MQSTIQHLSPCSLLLFDPVVLQHTVLIGICIPWTAESLCTCTCLSSANSSLQETKVIQNVNLFCLSSTPRKYTIYVSINSVFNVVHAKTAKTRTFNDLFAFKFTLDVNITTRVIRSIKQGTKGPQTFKLTNYDH